MRQSHVRKGGSRLNRAERESRCRNDGEKGRRQADFLLFIKISEFIYKLHPICVRTLSLSFYISLSLFHTAYRLTGFPPNFFFSPTVFPSFLTFVFLSLYFSLDLIYAFVSPVNLAFGVYTSFFCLFPESLNNSFSSHPARLFFILWFQSDFFRFFFFLYLFFSFTFFSPSLDRSEGGGGAEEWQRRSHRGI